MTRNNSHDQGRELSGLLHGLADDAARAPRARALDDMAATARTHGQAARRRRTAARSLVAAASVAVVAVGGVLVAQNLGGSPGPAPAAGPTDVITCGTFTPPTGGIDGLDLVLAAATPPLTASDLEDMPDVVAVLREDAAEPAVTLGSNGYVSYTVVLDGKIVAAPGGNPEPATQADLTAGGDPSPVFNGFAPVPCDPASTLPAGTYEVWATLDGMVQSGGTSREVPVVGGPWTVTIGAGVAPPTSDDSKSPTVSQPTSNAAAVFPACGADVPGAKGACSP